MQQNHRTHNFKVMLAMLVGAWLLIQQQCCAYNGGHGDVASVSRVPLLIDPLMRRSPLQKNFMRFGRSDPSMALSAASESNTEDPPPMSISGLPYSPGVKDKKIMRFNRGQDNFMRFGRSQDNMRFGGNKDAIQMNEENEKDLGRTDQFEENFMRNAKSLQKNNQIRLGRSQGNFMRFGKSENDNTRNSRSQDNFLRFGRNSDNFMRFGKSQDNNFMRFGRGQDNFMRFGRGQDGFMRFGRNKDNFMRFGRGQDNFMRFGRDQDNFMRFGKASENFMRFQRGQDNFLRFGRGQDNFMRFGKSSDLLPFSKVDQNFEEEDEKDNKMVYAVKRESDERNARRESDKATNFIRLGRENVAKSIWKDVIHHPENQADIENANVELSEEIRSKRETNGFTTCRTICCPYDGCSSSQHYLSDLLLSLQKPSLLSPTLELKVKRAKNNGNFIRLG